ncbi:cardiolipin synthase [Fulvimonas sp. R45]|uniref:cardiolipin synthase n=1 Tax=Fulvimonas sp. R45 TaxID=3045937 RepID=UPI00265D894C|nr:cardiolipin synthase [Fulvimonas sp. R45]MDO1528403.1 cardiolipin synthase [Fulvimonas sp. R45]
MPLPLTLVVALVHLAGLCAAAHAVMHTRTPQGAFAWALGLALLPWITLVPYLYLGRRRFLGYVVQHRRHRHQLALTQPRGDGTAAPACAPYAALCAMLDTRFHPGQQLRLLVDGEATFAAILAAIAQARHCVLVQFFILRDDGLGRRMQQALLERAAAGVDVCVLYDGIGSHALPRHYVETLRAGGVAIHPFATRQRHSRFQLNFRNHRKIVVVDGAVGYLGGLNVGDEYLGLKPPLAPWRDTHLELRGPAVGELQRSFAEDWHWVTGALPPLRTPPPGRGGAHTLVAATGPADRQESCSLFFVAAINAARRRLWLTTPYFVPDHAVMAALRLAVFRGVDVRVLIPSRADHAAVFLASALHARDAVRAGMRVFRHGPGFMHQKVLLVDDDTAAVGSMNLDSRSFRLNFEIAALNVDPAFAAAVEAMLRTDFGHAAEVAEAEYDDAPWLRRLAMHVARLFDPVL